MLRRTPVGDVLAFGDDCAQRYPTMPFWSSRGRGSHCAEAGAAMLNLLTWFAGGDVAGFLRDMLHVDVMPSVASEVYGAIEQLAAVEQACPEKERYLLVAPFKLSSGPFLSRQTLIDRGWTVSKNLWASCTSGAARTPGGRPPISADLAGVQTRSVTPVLLSHWSGLLCSPSLQFAKASPSTS